MSERTSLHAEHLRLGARMMDFHGWELPVQFESILAEHRHCRAVAALFDTSHMGQLRIRTRPEALARLTTQNAPTLPVGRCQYGLLLNEGGGILDDTILMRLGEEDFLLVGNGRTARSDFAWVSTHLGTGKAVLQSAEGGWSKLDLQGPRSAQILAPLTDADLCSLRYFHVTHASVCGQPCILSRTGYTGELGYEVFAPAEGVVAIFRELLANPLVRPAGLGARDSLRLEMGYPLYGQDMDAATNPFEASLEAFVRFEHDFIGLAALRAASPPGRRRVLFATAGRQRPIAGNELEREGRIVGRVTSAAFSPSLEVAIGQGYVSSDLAAPGTAVVVNAQRHHLAATITEPPLYRHGTCRTKELNLL